MTFAVAVHDRLCAQCDCPFHAQGCGAVASERLLHR